MIRGWYPLLLRERKGKGEKDFLERLWMLRTGRSLTFINKKMKEMRPFEEEPPEGYSEIEEEVTKMEREMDAVVNSVDSALSRDARMWPVFRINHRRTRFIYGLYLSGEIGERLFKFCLKYSVADRHLIGQWRKSGYERLCCLQCIQKRDMGGTSCVCRVPGEKLGGAVERAECVSCGCRGCARVQGAEG